MKSQIEIFNKRNQINSKKQKLIHELKVLEDSLTTLQSECEHDIVLAYEDPMIHKVGRILRCYCPSCGKSEDIFSGHSIEKTNFLASKLIDLTKIPFNNLNDSIPFITKHIFANYEYYKNANSADIDSSITELLKLRNTLALKKK